MRVQFIIALLLGLGTSIPSALACPLCHTSTADVVRAGLATTSKDTSVYMAMILPFVAIGAAIGFLNRYIFEIDDDRTQT